MYVDVSEIERDRRMKGKKEGNIVVAMSKRLPHTATENKCENTGVQADAQVCTHTNTHALAERGTVIPLFLVCSSHPRCCQIITIIKDVVVRREDRGRHLEG
jgi:hypothetical protein